MVKRWTEGQSHFPGCAEGALVWGRGFPGKYTVMYINKKGLKPNTYIGVNLKTLLRKDRQAKAGKNYVGVLSRDVECDEFLYDEHFTFIEMPPKPPVKHNPKVFDGKRISITRRDDGT